MKKLIIGRNNACDIVIPDTSDLVSRKQAVLTYSFWGKMVLYDTSNNGTYINGQKLENGKGYRVTRRDKVNFARIADLDWKEVKDPYRKSKILSIIFICVTFFIGLALLLALYFLWPMEKEPAVPEKMEMVIEQEEDVETVHPKEVDVEEQPVQQPVKTSKKRTAKPYPKQNSQEKEEAVSIDEMTNKEVNDNSPIVY